MPRKNDEKWLEQFEVYKRYVGENLRFPPALAVFEGYKIGQWFRNQITAYQNGFLPDDRKSLMDGFQPAWKESEEAKKEAVKQMVLGSDWRSKVPEGDVCLDLVLRGASLDACVLNGIYGCRQYLEYFELHHCCDGDRDHKRKEGRLFCDRVPSDAINKKFGDEVFSLKNRKAVFETAFPRLDFFAFNVMLTVEGSLPEPYLDMAGLKNVLSQFEASEEMAKAFADLMETLSPNSQKVINGRFGLGLSQIEIAEMYGVTTERIRQIEMKSIRLLRHPQRHKHLKSLRFTEALALDRGQELQAEFSHALRHDWYSIDISGSACRSLPSPLYINGDLRMAGTKVTELPEKIEVTGDVYLPKGNVVIPETAQIGGGIYQEREDIFETKEALESVEFLGLDSETLKVLSEIEGISTLGDLARFSDVDVLSFVGGSIFYGQLLDEKLNHIRYSVVREDPRVAERELFFAHFEPATRIDHIFELHSFEAQRLEQGGIVTAWDLVKTSIENLGRHTGSIGLFRELCKARASLMKTFAERGVVFEAEKFHVKETPRLLEESIDELDLSVRAFNCLRRANVSTVGDLVGMSREDLMRVRNMGRRCLFEIEQKLAMRGLRLAPEFEVASESTPKTQVVDESDRCLRVGNGVLEDMIADAERAGQELPNIETIGGRGEPGGR